MNNKQLLEQAQKLENEGQLREAIKLLVEVGKWQEAALLLIKLKCYAEAEDLLLRNGYEPPVSNSEELPETPTYKEKQASFRIQSSATPLSASFAREDGGVLTKTHPLHPCVVTSSSMEALLDEGEQTLRSNEQEAPEHLYSSLPDSSESVAVPTIAELFEKVVLPTSLVPPTNPGYPPSVEEDIDLFAVGALIGERYEILSPLGQGGVATVFRAQDRELEEEVALKVFEPDISEKLLLRIKQELKICRKLSHPNIIQVFDLGMEEHHHYLILELLSGRDLEELLAKESLEFGFGLDLLIQACDGLQATHELGVLHRDLKPSNLFVMEDGQLKIMDFGIALQHNGPRLTKAGTVIGTAAYMAPERISPHSELTVASDLYALGVIAFEIFTREFLFKRNDFIGTMMMHLSAAVPAPRSINPDIPEELERVICQLLEKKPEQRQQSCEELGLQLKQIRAELY